MKKNIILLVAILALSGCGWGGGPTDPSPVNALPDYEAQLSEAESRRESEEEPDCTGTDCSSDTGALITISQD